MMAARMRFAVLLLAACMGTGATAQDKPTACPAPAEITPQHLYGTWLAQVDGETEPVTIRLGKHPELAGSVSGEVERVGQAGKARAQVAGDVDEGDFTLEESSDGQRISATWIGQVVDASCGREIKGTWTKASDTSLTAPRSFTLRKQGGWQ